MKYLKESLCLAYGQHSSFKYFLKTAFDKKKSKMVRPVLAAVSINGLMRKVKPKPHDSLYY